ncbi:MAG: alpha-1,2-fucosyltransferase [Prolixibacteraceae bacterium]
MIIIRLRSGLGNQMFQYAFFRQMQYWHGAANVKLDISTYHWNVHNGREIDRVFNIDLQKDSVPPSVSLKYADVGYRLHQRLLRRLRGIRHHAYQYWKDIDPDDYKSLKDVYLEGFWNEEKYFRDVQEEIRQAYTFKDELNVQEKEMLHLILGTESVAVHVRRGDYKKFPKAFPMCPPSYYEEAQKILTAKKNNLVFFVFSDDMGWCKKSLSFPGRVVFVENNKPENAWKDMMLMSRCRHNIMANSTFSWWAAWLNNNPDKTVIYPESVFLTYGSMPSDWICVPEI